MNALAAALGVEIGDTALWLSALTHPSFTHEHPDAGHSYERLEFLGDALIGAAAAEILYDKCATSPPGELTFLRSVLVRRERLAEWAKTLPLRELVRFGKGAQRLDEQGLDTALADVAEALVAVIYLERGAETVRDVVRRGIARVIPSYAEARLQFEPKNVLQERLAAQGIESPSYKVVEDAPDAVTVEVGWRGGSARGTARSKREASVIAARAAVDALDDTGA